MQIIKQEAAEAAVLTWIVSRTSRRSEAAAFKGMNWRRSATSLVTDDVAMSPLRASFPDSLRTAMKRVSGGMVGPRQVAVKVRG